MRDVLQLYKCTQITIFRQIPQIESLDKIIDDFSNSTAFLGGSQMEQTSAKCN